VTVPGSEWAPVGSRANRPLVIRRASVNVHGLTSWRTAARIGGRAVRTSAPVPGLSTAAPLVRHAAAAGLLDVGGQSFVC